MNLQCVVYSFTCDLCDADYVGIHSPTPSSTHCRAQKSGNRSTFLIARLYALGCEWSRKVAPPSKPIRYKTKTNCDLVTRVFLRLRPNMRLLRFLIGSLWFFLCSDWPLWLLLFWFNGTQSKSPLSSTLIRTQTGYNPYVMTSYVILMFGWSVRSSRSI